MRDMRALISFLTKDNDLWLSFCKKSQNGDLVRAFFHQGCLALQTCSYNYHKILQKIRDSAPWKITYVIDLH